MKKSKDEEEARKRRRSAPAGCFSVYVGPYKQRFVLKTELANHPLFRELLEEAKSEFGYGGQGPLCLPCNVDVFYKVLIKMEAHRINHLSYNYLISPFLIFAINQC